jgi:hypothetical protein
MKRSHRRKQKLSKTLKIHTFMTSSLVTKKEGWKILTISGDPFERGYSHGYLLKRELQRVMFIMPFVVKKQLHSTMKNFLEICKKEISDIVKSSFQEFYNEIEGISAGAAAAGLIISVDYLIAWNSFLSMYDFFIKKGIKKEGHHGHCSAFIAVGNATETGKIVMAHSTHCDLVTASLFNIVMYIKPTKGFDFCMQTSAGFIASGSDFFISSSGIMGCETTISAINYKPIFKGNYPYFCRIRNAIQYGKSLEDYSKIMLNKNAGDYANSWLFGNINTNTIMLCEIGLKYHNIVTSKNGVFYGMNSAIGKKLRDEETDDISHTDYSKSSGARNARFNYLLNNKYLGKINIENAKLIISDHFDIYMSDDNPSCRTICNHSYIDKSTRIPCYPHLAVDAKICTSYFASKLSFYGIFGSSCGTSFKIEPYIRQNPYFHDWKKFLEDFPSKKWVLISSV